MFFENDIQKLILFIFYYLEFLIKKFSLKELIIRTTKLFTIFMFFLYLHYPYMWKLNIFEFFSWFKSFFYWMDMDILFNGKYYNIKYLPRLYLPTWIFISTPIFIIIFSVIVSILSTIYPAVKASKLEIKNILSNV